MCTRCVRFTREISGTAELQVVGRGHHEEIDVFPGRPLENKLSGNVVDLCPVGALGSKDFLYTQRVWYLKTTDDVCPGCSTGCSIHTDSNKDIVYRLRARENADAQGYFMCDEGRWGYHYANAANRITKPHVRIDGTLRPVPGSDLIAKLRRGCEDATFVTARRAIGVLSPFLTVEEAYSIGQYLKSLASGVRLVLGPVPVEGADDHYPKDVKGNAVEPRTFTIRAEKCPNRKGVEAVLQELQGEVIPFAAVASESLTFLWFAGGYPKPEWVDAAIPVGWVAPEYSVVMDLFPSKLTAKASVVLPATTAFEKAGTFVNHAGFAQTFPAAVRPPTETKTELQLANDLLGKKGLVQAASVRADVASAMPAFKSLAEVTIPKSGRKLELTTV